MTFCDNRLKSFNENHKQLTKMNDFLLFLRFHENHRILSCFHHRYDSACKNTLVSVYLLNFYIRQNFGQFSQKFENV